MRSGLQRAIVGLSTLLVAGATVITPVSASASPLDDARAKAAVLAKQVQTLQDEVEAASEAYAAASARLGAAVTTDLSSQKKLDQAQAALKRSQQRAGNQIRALWQDGGELGLIASFFSAQDLHDLANRTVFVQHILGTDQQELAGAKAKAHQAQKLSSSLQRATAQRTRLQQAADDAAARVRSILAEKQALLAAQTAQVRQLVAQQQVQQEAAAAAAFRARLIAAGQPVGVGTAGLPAATTPTALQAKVIAAARSQLGKPYVWGGTGPDGYDCSGLTGYAYAAAGISLPRTAAQQWLSGPHPAIADIQPGDLLFWASNPNDMSTIHHVAIYLGNGMMISTNHTGDVARVQPVWLNEFVGATRPDPAMAARVPGPRWSPGN